MTQLSRPWDGVSVGDATNAPYDAPNEWAKVWRSIAGAAAIPTNLSGVFAGELNSLAVTGAATPVSIATGRALTHGIWYESDAIETIAIPTPSGATRIDRIVLRKSWAAQTIRLTRIAGAEGGVAPALVQVDGTTWDQPLAQVSITTGGTITVTDERQFLSGAANLSPSRVVATDSNRQLISSITSANLRLSITDPTGTGAAVFGTSPTFTTSITIGTNAASSGAIRFANGGLLNSRNAANDGNVNIAFVDASNILWLGGQSGFGSHPAQVHINATSAFSIRTGATPASRLSLNSAGNVTIATPDSGVGLTVAGGVAITGLTTTAPTSGIVVGHSAQLAVLSGTTAALQVSGATSGNAGISVVRFTANAFGPLFIFGKSRNGTVGSSTIVQNNDGLGDILWLGADGTGFTVAANIRAEVDGTPGATNDMPGRLVFLVTPDGSGTSVEAMRIGNGRNVTIAAPASGVALTVAGDVTIANAGATNTLLMTSTNNHIFTGSTDGSDSRRLLLSGGGFAGSTRGASITLHGNEYSSLPGTVFIIAGNAGGAGDGEISLQVNAGIEQFRITKAGAITLGSSSLDAQINFHTGTTSAQMIIAGGAGGVILGNPTGSAKGLGSLNVAADVYKNNSAYANPDYVFEHYFTGKITKYVANPGADSYGGLMPLNDLREYVRENWRFPGITDEAMGIFDRGDQVLRLTEQNALYLFNHEDRITKLEEKVFV